MSSEINRNESERGATPRLHALAVIAVCLVWPLIWVGGLVTTYDAGMAVPDWPGTYGYNLFLYPISTWLYGPFDLLIEHGHRLLGAVVGFVAIGMLVAAFLHEKRRWVIGLTVLILGAVISQGALGGVRVLLGDRTVAMIHGCFGPVVFALCCIAATVTGKRWWPSAAESPDRKLALEPSRIGRGMLAVATLVLGLSYAQLVFGALLRHVQPTTTPGSFTLTVAVHIMTALFLWLLTPILWLGVRKCGDMTLCGLAKWLILFVGAQILLGTGTWIVNYGWPSVLSFAPFGEGFLVRAKGFLDSMIVTAHVAVGSLILATAAVILVRTLRQRCLTGSTSVQPKSGAVPLEMTGLPVAATV
ncbi:MAG: COX15/CtaA family protein [Planctomycetota bacterium]